MMDRVNVSLRKVLVLQGLLMMVHLKDVNVLKKNVLKVLENCYLIGAFQVLLIVEQVIWMMELDLNVFKWVTHVHLDTNSMVLTSV